MRVNGGSAQVSSKDSPYDKRAAMPQGKWKSTTKPVNLKAAVPAAPPIAPRMEFREESHGDKALTGPSRGFARKAHEARSLGGFDYGKEPVRGVNIGSWLVRECFIFL